MAGKPRSGQRPIGEPPPVRHGTWYPTEKGWAVRYTRSGADVRRVFGRPNIQRKLGVLTWDDATAVIARLDAEVDRAIGRCQTADPADQETVTKWGSVSEVMAAAHMNRVIASTRREEIADRPLEDLAVEFRQTGTRPLFGGAGYDFTTAAGWAHFIYDQKAKADQGEALADRLQPIVDRLMPTPAPAIDPNDSLDGLFVVWRKVNPTAEQRKVKAHLAKLKAFLGDGGEDGKGPAKFAWRDLTDQHARNWRDALVAQYGADSPSPEKHLVSMKQLFKAALTERWIKDRRDSPFNGVAIYGRKNENEKEKPGRPFNGHQVATILQKAPAWLAEFGRPDAEDFFRVIRLLAYQGFRPAEACNLLCSDLEVMEGVNCFRVRVSLPGEQPPGKKGMRRDVPLHPAVADIWDYGLKGDSEFLFPTLKKYVAGNRYGWLERNQHAFFKDVCGIFEPKQGDPESNMFTFYSLRHTFKDAAKAAGIDKAMCRELMGHEERDSHSRYGDGTPKRILAEAIARINPLTLRVRST